MASLLHPVLAAEVKRCIGEDPPGPGVGQLLEALSTRLAVIDDVRASDSESELEAFFRLSADLLVVLDESLRIRHLNTAFQALGYSLQSSRGASFLDLVAPSDHETARATLTSMLRTNEQVPLSLHVVTAEGATRVVHWQLATDGGGQRLYGVGRDVTDQRNVEQRLSQAKKLEAVGTLAAGVAHEMNTPLQFMGDNGRFVGESFEQLGPLFDAALAPEASASTKQAARDVDLAMLRKDLGDALLALKEGHAQLAALVQSLKQLAPSDGEAVEVTSVATLVPVFEDVVRRRHNATIVTEFEPIPPIVCDQAALARVLDALLSNAELAIGPKGHISVSTRVEDDEAVLRVTDDGCGMPLDVQAHVFEPFFTTREVGAGQGQSLAVARAVLERHHGSIGFVSEPGRGSTFTVRLPLQTVLDDAELWS
ncbi:MAG: PAS domain-containing protein [Archangiaceae bacterium]|nr:PAS domain-containing protein [Archangiaceae bacterium]